MSLIAIVWSQISENQRFGSVVIDHLRGVDDCNRLNEEKNEEKMHCHLLGPPNNERTPSTAPQQEGSARAHYRRRRVDPQCQNVFDVAIIIDCWRSTILWDEHARRRVLFLFLSSLCHLAPGPVIEDFPYKSSGTGACEMNSTNRASAPR
jgi:hypothetical protein